MIVRIDKNVHLQIAEFYARVDEARKGPSKSFDNVQDLDKYIRSL